VPASPATKIISSMWIETGLKDRFPIIVRDDHFPARPIHNLALGQRSFDFANLPFAVRTRGCGACKLGSCRVGERELLIAEMEKLTTHGRARQRNEHCHPSYGQTVRGIIGPPSLTASLIVAGV
jgi:hypothetical protein